jgi:TPP-dependent pyruvate/acetoin dehydrogenase alpha subunit
LLYWGGDDRGVHFPEENNDLIFAIPVGSHLTQAAGLAWSCKLKGDKTVTLAYLGDGTTSKGDFHEALTFAGQFHLPVIYLIENNHWAISVPREKQANTKTLAQKAAGYGVFGMQVDGNDVLAIHKAITEAVERARAGQGSSVIECETYRLGHHTTADDASRYRDDAEVEIWKKKEPIARFRTYLLKRGLLDDAADAAIRARAEAMIEEEVKAYEAFLPPNPLNMFSDNYAVATPQLVEQRAQLEELLKQKELSGEVENLPPAEGRFP